MFSDVVGYTAIMGRDERAGLRTVREHREHLRAVLPRFNGRLIGEIGDGTLSSFHSAVDAVNCARELQATLVENPELRLRIGIHVGDVVFTDQTVLGDGVNIASRLNAIASPGGVCISERVYDEIRNKPEIEVKDLGEKKLKNVARPIRVYALQAIGVDSSIRSRVGKPVAIGAIVSALMVAIVAAYVYRAQIQAALWRSGPEVAGGKVTLAVLPFANLSANKDDEYFSDGITDEIRGDLSKLAGLQVIARTSSYAFKGQNEDVKKIARLLNVRNVLEGSVRKGTDRVRIEVELIDAENGFTVWSDRYDEKLADVFQIQSDVAENVAGNLQVKLLGDEKARLESKPTQNLEAYNLYLLGNYYFEQFTPDAFAKAIESYSRAVEKDPRFARAYANLAYAYEISGDLTMPQRESTAKGKAAAARALEIDDGLGRAHGAMGIALLNDWDYTGAEPQFKRALLLDPGDAGNHEAYAEYLVTIGRYDEALRQRQRALELSPLWPGATAFVGIVYLYSRQYDRALEYYQESIRMAPDFYRGYQGRGWVLFCEGKTVAAVPDYEKVVALADFPLNQAALGQIYGLVGRRTDALRILDQLERQSTGQYVSPIAFVLVYWGLGDKDSAFQWLERAYEERSGYLQSLRAPVWDGLRADPRFQAIYKKVGLPE